MTAYINYFIEANLALLIILLIYRVFLANETSFRTLRLFLLGGVAMALIIPLIHFGSGGALGIPSVGGMIPANWLPEVVITGAGPDAVAENNAYPVWQIAGWIYFSVAVMLLIRFVFQLASLALRIRRSHFRHADGVAIAEQPGESPTFSFFHYIFIGRADQLSLSERQHIVAHEKVHARQWHSLDIIIVNLLLAIFWINPFIKLYQRYFVQLHEFEADARAVENSDANKYCSLLAKVALESADLTIANYFNNTLTVKRIIMIRTIKQKISRWRMLAAMSAMPMLLFTLAFQEQVVAQQQKANVPVSPSEDVYKEVDEMPTFQSGFDDLAKFLSTNMRYPGDARKKGIEGTVFVEFIVEKNGALSDIKVLRGIGEGCDDEALRVVNAMPRWNPGVYKGKIVRTKMVLPLKFKLG